MQTEIKWKLACLTSAATSLSVFTSSLRGVTFVFVIGGAISMDGARLSRRVADGKGVFGVRSSSM